MNPNRTPTAAATPPRVEAADIKQAAAGRWREILERVGGIDPAILDGQHHACPRCGGTDRFRAFDDGTGGVFCNQCHATENGDGLSTLQWLLNCDFPTALAHVADYLGVKPSTNGHAKLDPLESLARAKSVSVAALQTYGAKVDGRAVVVPMYGANGEQCSTFTITPDGTDKQRKGLCEKGKRAGVFLPSADGKPRLPAPGETWDVVEGCKDAAALHALGYLAIGLPTSALPQRFAPMLSGCHLVIVPDRDTAGETGADKTAARLRGHAATIRVAVLPAEHTASDGADVRDVLRMPDGERLLREAIDKAKVWQPPTLAPTSDGIPSIAQPDGRTEAANARRLFARFGGVLRWVDP